MSKASTTTEERDRFGLTAKDRARRDAMTDAEINRAAASDPDNPPLTDAQLAQFRHTALARKVRHKLHMSRESFADAFGIPLDKLRAWERHEAEPTEVEMVYLRLIERAPELAKVQPVPA